MSRLPKHSRKNVEGVIRAVALLAPELNLSYTIVGDGEDRDRLESLSHELGVADKVKFTGRVAVGELLTLYAHADLFVLTPVATDIDIEGFGIVYNEASASGVPVLGSSAGGAIDAISDGTNGILIPKSTPTDIASGIRHFLDRRELITEDRCRHFAEQFRWGTIASHIRTHIRNAVSAVSPTCPIA